MADQGSLTISVEKLAEIVEGEILNCSDSVQEVVQNLMVGAMCVDPAPDYFAVRSDKAVITRGDRSDIQLGALQTPTKCLVLTGGIKPSATVMELAEQNCVPVISVSKSTPETLTMLEQALGQLFVDTPASDAATSEEVAGAQQPVTEG